MTYIKEIYIKEVLIITYSPHCVRGEKEQPPQVDVEFHRSNRTFKEFENVSSKQLRTLSNALKEIHPNSTSVRSEWDSIIAEFRI